MAVAEQDFSTFVQSIQEDDWVIYLKIFCNFAENYCSLSKYVKDTLNLDLSAPNP